MAHADPDPVLLRYVETNLIQAEAQCMRLARLIKCRRAKGRATSVYEKLLADLRDAVAHVLRRLPLSAGD